MAFSEIANQSLSEKIDHNLAQGLQGGTTNREMYHLTAAELAALLTAAQTTAIKAAFADFTAVTNVTDRHTFDANDVDIAELADFVGHLANTLLGK